MFASKKIQRITRLRKENASGIEVDQPSLLNYLTPNKNKHIHNLWQYRKTGQERQCIGTKLKPLLLTKTVVKR